MPHKRAKRSTRLADREKKGFNLAPSNSYKDDTPRGAMRIFNAHKLQTAFRAKGRTNSEDTGERAQQGPGKGKGKRPREDGEGEGEGESKPTEDESKPKKAKAKAGAIPKIGEHESLGDYNRRVEALMRTGVNQAIKSAESARGQQIRQAQDDKKARIAKAQGKELSSSSKSSKKTDEEELKPNRPLVEFKELPKHKRLNDVAQAPPQLPRMRQAVKAERKGLMSKADKNPLNAGQRRIMEEERERVIGMYREMKAKKEAVKAEERAAKAPKAKPQGKGAKGDEE